MAARTICKTMRENIAACAVHGVTYWSDHPEKATFWATTDDQQYVTVKIDRKRQTSYLDNKSGKRFWAADDLAGVAAQLDYVDVEQLIEQAPPKPYRISEDREAMRILRENKSTEQLLGELQQIIDRRKPREVVLAGIAHDPTWLVGFTVQELTDALEHTPHAEAVQNELDRRKQEAS